MVSHHEAPLDASHLDKHPLNRSHAAIEVMFWYLRKVGLNRVKQLAQ